MDDPVTTFSIAEYVGKILWTNSADACVTLYDHRPDDRRFVHEGRHLDSTFLGDCRTP